MKIQLFKQEAYAEGEGINKVLMLKSEKTPIDMAVSGEEELSFNADKIPLKSQEVAQYNEGQKKMVLSFAEPSTPRQFDKEGYPLSKEGRRYFNHINEPLKEIPPEQLMPGESQTHLIWKPYAIELKYIID